MALTQVTGPYPIFTDLDGSPLDDGYLYIGSINEDPEVNPIQVYWDSALTIPATQPIRTNNGYAWRNGTPALIYTSGEFSITIRNKRGEFVLYSPVGYGFDPASVSASVVKSDFTGDGVTVDFTLSASPSTKLATSVFINGVYQEKDSYSILGNVLTFTVAPPLSSSIEVMTNETGVIGSTNASLVSYTAGFTGAVGQTVQTKLEQYVSVKDFGAVGDGVTNDTAAVQAADAWGAHTYSPEGTYDTTLVSNTIEGPYWGSGQIRDSLNNKRGPWFSAVMSAPSPQGNETSIETAFNGDLSKNQIAMEHRITGAATLGQPATGYEYTPEAYPFYGYLYNASGWNQATTGNDGRTGAAFFRVKVDNYGQGDLVCYNGTAFVTGQRAGATTFLANPATSLFNGDMSAGANGVYLNPYETYVRDNGYDVAAIGSVLNMDRSNHTGALDCWWAGIRVQSKGASPCNAIMSFVGKFDNGIDFTPSNLDFGANQAAISMRQNQRIYFNNASSNDNYTTTYNGWWVEYSSSLGGIQFVLNGASEFQLTPLQVTVNSARFTATDRVQFTALGNYANDAAAAAAGVNINELYRNGSVVQIRVT